MIKYIVNPIKEYIEKKLGDCPVLAGFVEFGLALLFAVSIYHAVVSTKVGILLWMVGAAVSVSGACWIHTHWTYCHLCRETESNAIRHICRAEEFRKIVRCSIYLAIIFLIVNANWLQIGVARWVGFISTNYTAIKTTGLTTLSLALFLTSFETLSRKTFRKWPVYFLSAGATILFLVFMDIPYAGNNLAWELLDTTQISTALNDLPGIISNSIIAAAAVSLVFFLVKERWGKHQKKLTEDMVKETRRHILSHWDFRPMNPLSNDAINRIIILFATLCLIAGFMVFTKSPQKQQDDSTDQSQTTEIADTDANHNYAADKVSNKHKKDGSDKNIAQQNNEGFSNKTDMTVSSETAEPEEEGISFTGYTLLLAVVLLAIGITSHFDIGDKALIESEYYYLLYHSLDPIWNPQEAEPFVGAKELRRSDYFQVLSYLYSNGSTIKSEECEWHKLGAVLKRLYDNSSTSEESGRASFLSRMIYSYTEIKEQVFLNQGTKEETIDLPGKLRTEQIVPTPEMLFARELIALVDSIDTNQLTTPSASTRNIPNPSHSITAAIDITKLQALVPTPEKCDNIRMELGESVALMRLSRLRNLIDTRASKEIILSCCRQLETMFNEGKCDDISRIFTKAACMNLCTLLEQHTI